jgi:hypothetical protein
MWSQKAAAQAVRIEGDSLLVELYLWRCKLRQEHACARIQPVASDQDSRCNGHEDAAASQEIRDRGRGGGEPAWTGFMQTEENHMADASRTRNDSCT